MTYNPNIGAPGVRPVAAAPYRRDADVDLPRNYAEASAAFWNADKRRGKARGMLAHNTKMERFQVPSGELQGDNAYAIVLHGTRVVTFLPCGAIIPNTGGWQTPTTRDRMNRCGLSVYMGGGVAFIRHGAAEYVYVDGMRLNYNSRGEPVSVWYPNIAQPVGTPEEVRSRRRRVLAHHARLDRMERGGITTHPKCWTPFYWPNKRGGKTRTWGNCPEAFRSDYDVGLKPKTRQTDSAAARFVSGLEPQ